MHRATGFHHQPRQQGILFWRQFQRRLTQPHQAAGDVEAQIADADFVIALVIMPAEQGANARIQLFQGKGFHQIVIRAGIETANAILKRIAGGEDQHRLGHLLPPHTGEKMQTVFIRQAEVEYDQAVVIAGQR